MTYPVPYQLLYYLSDSQWIPSAFLAKKSGIAEAAISKQIKLLRSEGIVIEHSHRGYRLKDSLTLLDEEVIRNGIDQQWYQEGIQLCLLPTIDSTNVFIKQFAKNNFWTLCLSEKQTAGRGRLGRSWASPFGENIYLSFAWYTTESLVKLSGLSIAVSLALRQVLSSWINDLQVKWPNDLLWHGKKLAGCLIEVTAENSGGFLVIAGIGININTLTNVRPLSSRPHCSMRDILNDYFNRNEIIIAIINHCLQSFRQFECQGLLPLLDAWKEVDYLYDQRITIYQPHQTIQGIAKGINTLGHLLLEREDGYIKEINAGEASLSTNQKEKPA